MMMTVRTLVKVMIAATKVWIIGSIIFFLISLFFYPFSNFFKTKIKARKRKKMMGYRVLGEDEGRR